MYSRDKGRGTSREGGGETPWIAKMSSSPCHAGAPTARFRASDPSRAQALRRACGKCCRPASEAAAARGGGGRTSSRERKETEGERCKASGAQAAAAWRAPGGGSEAARVTIEPFDAMLERAEAKREWSTIEPFDAPPPGGRVCRGMRGRGGGGSRAGSAGTGNLPRRRLSHLINLPRRRLRGRRRSATRPRQQARRWTRRPGPSGTARRGRGVQPWSHLINELEASTRGEVNVGRRTRLSRSAGGGHSGGRGWDALGWVTHQMAQMAQMAVLRPSRGAPRGRAAARRAARPARRGAPPPRGRGL